MAFTLIYKTLALILLFNLHERAIAVQVHPLPIYDANPTQLEAVHNQVFCSIPEKKVDNWPETFNVVMRGQGVEIQRRPEVQASWGAFIDGKSLTEIETHFANLRGWSNSEPKDYPKVLGKDYVKNTDWVQFTPALYPINVPNGIDHVILWLRGPMTTQETFSVRAEDSEEEKIIYQKLYEKISNQAYLNDAIEFIHAHDAFGTNVDPKKYDVNLKIGQELRIAPKKPNGYDGKVPKDEGIQAMLWSSRHITRLIEAKYPGKEFVWFRVNRSLRSFQCPNEIHVLILNKVK